MNGIFKKEKKTKEKKELSTVKQYSLLYHTVFLDVN